MQDGKLRNLKSRQKAGGVDKRRRGRRNQLNNELVGKVSTVRTVPSEGRAASSLSGNRV